MKFRQGGDVWGSCRVLEPGGALPQAAVKLDNRLPPYDNEILVSVEKLQIDAVSFNQLMKDEGSSFAEASADRRGTRDEIIKERILEIVKERGKMHNPVTNSGGVFLGKVEAIGSRHPLKEKLKVGDTVVSLVSLTLTPLILETITKVDVSKAQVLVRGHAIIFESGMAAKLPQDLPEGVVLAALDVCGAPAQIKRLVRAGEKVLIVGLGKSGKAMAVQAQEMGALVFGVDHSEEAVSWCQKNLKGHYAAIDAGRTLAAYKWVKEVTRESLVDLSVNAAHGEGTEMSSILSCRDGGRVLFFGMNTSFQRVTLGAEGIGKDVMILMGSGFVPGHAEVMLDLLRGHQALREWFGEHYA